MSTRVSRSALLYVCALSCTQFAAADTISDQLFFDIWNPATSQFQTFKIVTLTEGGSESETFTIPAPPPIDFLEPDNPSHTSDSLQLPSIKGTITSDTETTPERGGSEGPLTIFSISLNLANDTGKTNLGQTFSLTEAGERDNSTVTVRVPGFHPMIPGDDVDISPFTFTFFSDPNEVGSEKEETFNDDVFRIVLQSDADVPEPGAFALTGGLLILGVAAWHRRILRWRQSGLTPRLRNRD